MQSAARPERDSSIGPTHLPGIDGLRAISIALVLLLHTSQRPGFPANEQLRRFASHGGFGVEVFFVISGFLITWLLVREERAKGAFGFAAFYRRRALRILPPAFAYLTVVALVSGRIGQPVSLRDLAAAALFFRNLIVGDSRLTGHYWSLSIEEQFYLAWPFLLWSFPKSRRLSLTILLCALAPVWRQINMHFFGAQNVNFQRADLRFDGLLVGAGLALAYESPHIKAALLSFCRRGVLCCIAVAILVGSFAIEGRVGAIATIAFPSIRYVAVAGVLFTVATSGAPALTRLLEVAPIRWLGRISYALYLCQQLTCFPDKEWTFSAYPVDLLAAIGLAALVHYGIERPTLRFRAQLERRIASRTAAKARPQT